MRFRARRNCSKTCSPKSADFQDEQSDTFERQRAVRIPPAIVFAFFVPALQAQAVTDWQASAGRKMAFEVASVKPGKGAATPSNVLLTPWDDYSGTSNRFSADSTLTG